ncbi:MAG: translation initiation factor IF-6 [Candidatus Hadarchaeales archaeon]
MVRMSFGRVPFIGAFSVCTDSFAVLPDTMSWKRDRVVEALGVPAFRGNLSRSPLVGILTAGNSSSLICSEVFDMAVRGEGSPPEVKYLPGKHTAFGNMVLANDRGALVSPDLPAEVVAEIEKALGVKVERGTLGGLKNVGAAGVATGKGALVSPDATEDEIRRAERVLGVPVDVGTACGGVKLVGLCMVANSNGALVGLSTTGPELGRIESALGFV